MRMMISDDYIPGAYTREELRGYLQFFQFMNSSIVVDKTRGRRIASDVDARWWQKKGVISQTSYERYMEELLTFMDFERVATLTDEQIAWQVERLRRDCLSDSEKTNVEQARQELLKNFLWAFETVGFPKSEDKWFDRRIPMGEARYITRKIRSGKDVKQLKKTEVQARREDYLIDLGKLQELIADVQKNRKIKIFSSDFIFTKMFLYELDGRFGKGDKLDCTIFIKEDPLFREPHESDFREGEYKDIDIHLKKYRAENVGVDLRDEMIQEELAEEESLLIVIGENAGMTFEGFNGPYWMLAVLETDKFCKYLGVLPSFEKSTKRAYIKKVTPGWPYSFKKRFNGMERSTFNVNADLGNNRNNFMNMFSMSYDSEKFPEFQISSDSWTDIISEREGHLTRKIEQLGLKYEGFQLNHDDGQPIRFDTIKLGKSKSIMPCLAQDYQSSLISIRDFERESQIEDGQSVFINFLYFATQKLVNLYNAQRPEQEHLTFSDFYIDSIFNREKGITTFPLYNKGFVGSEGENLIFGTERLGPGKLRINAFDFEWPQCGINTEKLKYRPVLFTPEFFQKNGERFESLIDDRVNVVIINDCVVAARKGIVKMPSLGAVLSIPLAFEDEMREKMQLEESRDGYYKIEGSNRVMIELEQNKRYTWKYGGGTLLVKDGVNLVEDEKTAEKTFYDEGWYNPLSMETQETQVQDWVRGPRSVIGEDMEGNIFLGVFSGRTKESVGARFDEVVSIIERNFCSVKNLLNLDGGASSCLGLIYKKEFFELSLPCATNFTTTGMVRPVNSFLIANI